MDFGAAGHILRSIIIHEHGQQDTIVFQQKTWTTIGLKSSQIGTAGRDFFTAQRHFNKFGQFQRLRSSSLRNIDIDRTTLDVSKHSGT